MNVEYLIFLLSRQANHSLTKILVITGVITYA